MEEFSLKREGGREEKGVEVGVKEEKLEGYEEKLGGKEEKSSEKGEKWEEQEEITAGNEEKSIEKEGFSSEGGSISKENPGRDNYAHLFVFSNDKAGMKDIDRPHVDQVIYEASKNSEYFKNELRKSEQIDKQIEKNRSSMETFRNYHPAVQKRLRAKAELMIQRLKESRDPQAVYLHIDMDMYFCAVEIRDNPALKDIPLAVGGPDMICTSNYVARKYGVRAAMPGFIGKKLCPELFFLKPNFQKYSETAQLIRKVIAHYDPSYRAHSLDEASVCLTDYLRTNQLSGVSAVDLLVKTIRKQITEVSGGLTCSAGIAPSRMMSKICSDLQKPDGQTHLEFSALDDFLATLKVRKLPGVGKVRERVLEAMSMKVCKDITDNPHLICHVFSDTISKFLMKSALGMDAEEDASSQSLAKQKSISSERTFAPIKDLEAMKKIMRTLGNAVANDLRTHSFSTQHITLKVKLSNFEVKTLAKTLESKTVDEEEITRIGLYLLSKFYTERAVFKGEEVCVRLLGLRCASLTEMKRMTEKRLLLKTVPLSSLQSDKAPSSSSTVEADAFDSVCIVGGLQGKFGGNSAEKTEEGVCVVEEGFKFSENDDIYVGLGRGDGGGRGGGSCIQGNIQGSTQGSTQGSIQGSTHCGAKNSANPATLTTPHTTTHSHAPTTIQIGYSPTSSITDCTSRDSFQPSISNSIEDNGEERRSTENYEFNLQFQGTNQRFPLNHCIKSKEKDDFDVLRLDEEAEEDVKRMKTSSYGTLKTCSSGYLTAKQPISGVVDDDCTHKLADCKKSADIMDLSDFDDILRDFSVFGENERKKRSVFDEFNRKVALKGNEGFRKDLRNPCIGDFLTNDKLCDDIKLLVQLESSSEEDKASLVQGELKDSAFFDEFSSDSSSEPD